MQLISYILPYLDFHKYLPAAYSSIPLVILFLIGLALLLAGKYAWKITFALLGAYAGGMFSLLFLDVLISHNVIPSLTSTLSGIPVILFVIVGAIIGAIITLFLVRLIVSAGLAYIFFIIGGIILTSIIYAIILAIIVFVIAYILYEKIIVIITGFVGMVLVWYVLVDLKVSATLAIIIALILFIIGIYVQMYRKKSKKKKEEKENK